SDALAAAEGKSDAKLVDIRSADEYQGKVFAPAGVPELSIRAGHIPGALLLPNEVIAELALSQLPDLDAEILLYCRSGNRSRQAADTLVALGYTRVYDFGGIQSWPYETVSGEQKPDAPLASTEPTAVPPINPGCTDESCPA
ncbi:MAG: rhodanese-like domain-containing protein, partial [Oscillospiraceae bacterium]